MQPPKPVAIFLCDRTGVAAKPWAEAGIECWCVDVQHSIRRERVDGLVHYVWGDVRTWHPPDDVRVIHLGAMPPCTDVAVSGARDFVTKGLGKLVDALTLFNACIQAAEWCGAPYWIENPVGVLSSHIRKPDWAFNPCDFAGYRIREPETDAYTKKTCLWTGNGFVMPDLRPVVPVKGSLMHTLPPSKDRGDLRSVTPEGFSRAVFSSNHREVMNAAA